MGIDGFHSVGTYRYLVGSTLYVNIGMISKLNEILEGWANVVKDHFNAVDPQTKEKSRKRLFICNGCSMRQGNMCSPHIFGYHIETNERKNGCGCNISAKSLSPSSICPLGKWDK